MRSTSYRFDKKSYVSFRLVPISVTLNELERRNGPFLRYFTESGNGPYLALFHRIRVHVVVKQLSGLSRFQNLLFIVYDYTNTTCAIIQRLFMQNKP